MVLGAASWREKIKTKRSQVRPRPRQSLEKLMHDKAVTLKGNLSRLVLGANTRLKKDNLCICDARLTLCEQIKPICVYHLVMDIPNLMEQRKQNSGKLQQRLLQDKHHNIIWSTHSL